MNSKKLTNLLLLFKEIIFLTFSLPKKLFLLFRFSPRKQSNKKTISSPLSPKEKKYLSIDKISNFKSIEKILSYPVRDQRVLASDHKKAYLHYYNSLDYVKQAKKDYYLKNKATLYERKKAKRVIVKLVKELVRIRDKKHN